MIGLILATVLTVSAPQKPDTGWFFYEEPPKKEKEVKKKKSPPPEKKVVKREKKEEKKKGFQFPVRPDAPEPVKEFLLNPNEQTAKAFLKWQSEYFNHLRKIAFTLRETYLKYGKQIYNVAGYPETVQFADMYNARKDYFFAQVLSRFKDNLGFLFFYKEGCPYCEAEKKVILFLYSLGLSIRGVSYNQIDKKLPFKNVVAPALFEKFSVNSVPTLIAVFEKEDGSVKTAVVGRGLTPLDQIERNTLMFLSSIGELQTKDYNPNYQGFWGEPVRGERK